MLRCMNLRCESHTNGEHMFQITASVSDERELTENLQKLDADDFKCSFCGDTATEVEDE